MGKVMILNGSPRAPKSNSKLYSSIFMEKCKSETEYFHITKSNHDELCDKMKDFSDVLLVFPLYADGVPVTLLNFLKVLENKMPKKALVISVLINCGFLEYQQNDLAVQMIALFCRKNHCHFGAVLKIGSGEAILSTPFRMLVVRKIKQFANSICSKKYRELHITMPIPSQVFIRASTRYWINYGKKNGITEEQMRTMDIE